MSPYSLEIHPINNGWVVKVGCQLVAFTDRDHLIQKMDEYLRDPRKFIRAYEEQLKKEIPIPVPAPECVRNETDRAEVATSSPGRLEALLRRPF
jgi:hypothetical protein